MSLRTLAHGPCRELARRLLFQTIHDVELMLHRERAGREASPTAAVIDSRSSKAQAAATRGYDAGKKKLSAARGISRWTPMDGFSWCIRRPATSDGAGAQVILDAIRERRSWVRHPLADGACDRLALMDKAAFLEFVVEIIRRSDRQKGFEVPPRRWIVARGFGWMTRWRRLVRDHETRIDVSRAMIHVAIRSLVLRRNAHS